MPSDRFYDWIAHYADRRPDHVAVHDLASDRHFHYRTLHRRVDALARHFQSTGIQPGQRIAMLAYNSSDVFEVQFACWRVGAIFVPLNWRLAAREITTIANDAQPSLLVLDEELTQLAEAIDAPTLRTTGRGGPSAYEAAIADGGAPDRHEPTLDETGTLLYTAGTTGTPKGARVTHAMTFYNAINLAVPARITRDSVHLVALPLFHTGGLNCYANVVFHAGGTNLVLRSWDPAEALRHLANAALGVTHFFGVPAHYQFLAEQPGFADARLSLVTAGVGGAPCPLAMLEQWSAKGVPMQQGYGMTETSPTVLVLDTERAKDKLGSAGLPALHTEVELRTADGERIDGANVVGELCVRGPNVTPGYWHLPDADAAAFSEGGWLGTGDAARRDEDGYYFIVDRWKDMFISGGENVYPAEVENALYELDGVVEVAVVGVSDDRWGEVGRAFVVTCPGVQMSEDDVLTHCRSALARFKVPKSVIFVDALPRNAAGKILKRQLKERGETK